MDGDLYKIFEGTPFNDKYRLVKFLGAGNYGAVFLADEVMGDERIQTVALKAIRQDKTIPEKIVKELQTAIRLRHVRLLHCITSESGKLQRAELNMTYPCYGLIMEVAGINLENYLEQHKKLNPTEARSVLTAIAEGLNYLHHEQLVTHRDLKPANVLQVGATWKISDFGIVREMSRESGTLTQSLSGTPVYMPPEAYVAQEQHEAVKVAPAWDMWSFGIMTAQILTGDLPFDGLADILAGNVRSRLSLPEPFDYIVQGCLGQDPATRWTAQQVLDALQPRVQPSPPFLSVPSIPKTSPPPSSPPTPAIIQMPERGSGKVLQLKIPGSAALEVVQIPSGSFEMGSNEYDDEQPIHRVTLKSYWMGKYPITQEQYQAIMGENPSKFKGNLKHPVERVSWHDAIAFCKKLSQQSGQAISLPSEAQWEYACRAGSKGKYCYGDDENQLKDYAWFKQNSNGQTHPVGQKKPNQWGLYDMHGNVWEWCLDHWHSNYNKAPDNGSAWIDRDKNENDNHFRLLRGGSWLRNPGYCRSALRLRSDAGDRALDLGFRVVLDSVPSSS